MGACLSPLRSRHQRAARVRGTGRRARGGFWRSVRLPGRSRGRCGGRADDPAAPLRWTTYDVRRTTNGERPLADGHRRRMVRAVGPSVRCRTVRVAPGRSCRRRFGAPRHNRADGVAGTCRSRAASRRTRRGASYASAGRHRRHPGRPHASVPEAAAGTETVFGMTSSVGYAAPSAGGADARCGRSRQGRAARPDGSGWPAIRRPMNDRSIGRDRTLGAAGAGSREQSSRRRAAEHGDRILVRCPRVPRRVARRASRRLAGRAGERVGVSHDRPGGPVRAASVRLAPPGP